ncbi:MAG: amt [Phycisphaerales bacterium]|nr:amt [Phycisphaerales bacterium]
MAVAAVVAVTLAASQSSAQTAPTSAPTMAMAAAPAAPAAVPAWQAGKIDTGSTAWLLISSALVLFMVPGLALFYGGMVRAKNVLNMFLCCMVTIGVMGIIWIMYGYAVAFPTVTAATKLIGSSGDPIVSYLAFDKGLLFLNAFNGDWGRILTSGDTTGAVPTGIPELAFVMFQGKFFIITPALIVGSVAERVRFGPFLLFMIIWSTIVYLPVAHWVWNVNGWLFQKGVLDFAGGTVVHVLAGVSALAVCLVVGPRTGYGKVPMPPHSLGLTLIGAGLLWFGWFGFNAGSAVAIPGSELPVSGTVAALAFTNTQTAAAAAATAWMLIEWIHGGKPTILGFASGMVAGLVVITPCAGHVLPWSAMLIGAIGGGVCYFACRLKGVFGYDDSLDAFGVHGVGGALGALLVGIFAVRPVMGGMEQLGKQALGVGVSVVYCFVLSFILAKVIAMTIGLRAKTDDEIEGLDIALHGESGYHLSMTDMEGYSYGAEGTPDARGTAAAAR